MAYGLQFTEGSQDKNSRQELEAESNGFMLFTGLLSYFSYTGKAHVSKEGTLSGLNPPPSITNQEMPNMHAYKPI